MLMVNHLVGFGAGAGGIGNDSFTKVLLHFEGANNGTVITDSNLGGSAHTWTAAGNAVTSTAAWKFGATSLSCDGTGDYVSMSDHADLTLGSGNFVADCWIRVAGGAGTRRFAFGHGNSGATTSAFYIEVSAANKLSAGVGDGSGYTVLTGTTNVTVDGLFHHAALIRSGSTIYLALDGVIEDSDTFAGSVLNSTASLAVGRHGDLTTLTWNGYIDEFRLSVGTDREWTSTFTPPTRAYD